MCSADLKSIVKRFTRISLSRILHGVAVGLLLACLAGDGEAWAEPKGIIKITPSHVYDVPTSGKILDVDYRPEFDEWWVKCREGEGVAVYSYDRETKKWSKVVFTPGKPKTEPRKPEKDIQLEKPRVTPETKKEEPSDKEKAKPEPEKTKPDEVKPPEAGKDEKPQQEEKSDKRKWWNPFELLKKGEKLIRTPFSPDPSKKQGKPDNREIDY